MPIYEFQCTKCGEPFEAFRKVSSREEPLSEPCPKCSEVGFVESRLSTPSFTMNGALPVNGKLRDKLRQIHDNTPGSRLDTTSSITKI